MHLLQQEESQLLENISNLESKLSQLRSALGAALEAESQILLLTLSHPKPNLKPKHEVELENKAAITPNERKQQLPTFRDRYIQAFKHERLLRDKEGMRILAKIGFDIRNRFLEYEYIQQCDMGSSTALSRRTVETGDLAAREPDALADAYLYHDFSVMGSCEGDRGMFCSFVCLFLFYLKPLFFCFWKWRDLEIISLQRSQNI